MTSVEGNFSGFMKKSKVEKGRMGQSEFDVTKPVYC